MSDLYNMLIDELEKCDIFVRYSTIEPKIILDLSEHDKPFKVKIRELKESYQKNTREILALEKEVVNYKQAFEDKCADYNIASELLGKYQQENEALKKRVVELENFSCQAEQETESLVEKLKQRIAELEQSRSEWIDKSVEWQQKCEKLESKESVKSMRIEFHADNGEMLTPLEVANSLINQNTFKVDELRELSEFLQVYCNHHEDRDIEPNIMLF